MSLESSMLETTSFKFRLDPGKERIILGQVRDTSWHMRAQWITTSTYGYDLNSLELIRFGPKSEVRILANVMQSRKDQSPLYLLKNFACLYTIENHISIFGKDFIAAFDNTDKLKGTVTIIDMARCKPVNETSASNSLLNDAVLSASFPQLSDDLACLLDKPNQFSDIILKCEKNEIPVHKCILSARSPVFAAMFRNQDMQESRSGNVDIIDISAEALQALLRYIYSGKVDDLSEFLASDLLFAADKYELEVLKRICVDKLKCSLSMDNIVHVLVLGHLHDDELKEYAKKFICEQDKFLELEEAEQWKSLQKEHPVLAMEVLMFVVKYLKSSS